MTSHPKLSFGEITNYYSNDHLESQKCQNIIDSKGQKWTMWLYMRIQSILCSKPKTIGSLKFARATVATTCLGNGYPFDHWIKREPRSSTSLNIKIDRLLFSLQNSHCIRSLITRQWFTNNKSHLWTRREPKQGKQCHQIYLSCEFSGI